jgi:hypothetical protein
MNSEIEFELSLDDVETYNLYYLRNVLKPLIRNRNRIVRIGFGFLFAIWIFIILDVWFSEHIITAIIMIASIILVIGYSMYLNTSTYIRKRIKEDLTRWYGHGKNDVIGRHKLSVSDDGINDLVEIGQSSVSWEAIEEVISTDKYIFLTMTGGSKAIIIPKSAFSDDTSLNNFIAKSEEYHNKASTK